jgi:hypothetical protein
MMAQSVELSTAAITNASRNAKNTCCLVVISYNMHGPNQGVVAINDLICKLSPDVIALQEHWLTPDNLYKLSELSIDYFVCLA